MNQNNRVLNRKGARELSGEEVGRITGGLITISVCTFSKINGNGGDETNPAPHDGC